MYRVVFEKGAIDGLKKLQKHAPQALSKLEQLLAEIAEHPRSGTGQAERLKHFTNETWSRRITREHRIVYEVRDQEILVLVLSVFGHY